VEASVLWLAHEQGRLEACISPITLVNAFYILRKQEGATPHAGVDVERLEAPNGAALACIRVHVLAYDLALLVSFGRRDAGTQDTPGN
jgi:hypothetical protein